MSYIEVYPKNTKAQDKLSKESEPLFTLLVGVVEKAYGVPEYDIIVELNRCSVIQFNAKAIELNVAPDVVIKISTSDTEFMDNAEELKDLLVSGWKELFGADLTMECWLDFFHTWGCTIDFS